MTDAPASLVAPKRFYTTVTVESGAIKLDGRAAKTPGGAPLVLPTPELAELVAEEWRGQGATIVYSRMPATRLAHTVIDAVADARDATVDSIVRFAASDLLCYFAEDPGSLVARQEATWRPLIHWAWRAQHFAFETTAGIVHRAQPPETLARVKTLVAAADDFTLAGLAFAASLFGSAILALALRDRHIDAGEAIAAARLDDLHQEERWGVDVETIGRTEALITDAIMLEAWFRGLHPSPLAGEGGPRSGSNEGSTSSSA
jgi:chaperone required for assembly of F1-ATPase